MKRCGISGSRRMRPQEVERDVRSTVRDIMSSGDGIVSGGALGVDQRALYEALLHNPSADRIKILLPVPLPLYAKHYFKRAQEGVITQEDCFALLGQLYVLSCVNPQSLVAMDCTVVNKETYFARNSLVVDHSDILYGFWVNRSQGVADTLQKAKHQGKEIVVREYAIE